MTDEKSLIADISTFIECGGIEDFCMIEEDSPNKRTLQDIRVADYLTTIVDPEAKVFAQSFLHHTKYVPFDSFYMSLNTSIAACVARLRKQPWSILLPRNKNGSEWWLTQMLVQHQFKDCEPSVVSTITSSTPCDLVIIDDCAYSGNNILSIIDNLLWNIKNDNSYTFHLVVPYFSKEAYLTLKQRIPTFKQSRVEFYFVNQLWQGILDLDPKLALLYDANGCLKKNVALALNIDSCTNFIPIYFDHKIAGSMSTAESILQAVVFPEPSRKSIQRAESCYRKVFNSNHKSCSTIKSSNN